MLVLWHGQPDGLGGGAWEPEGGGGIISTHSPACNNYTPICSNVTHIKNHHERKIIRAQLRRLSHLDVGGLGDVVDSLCCSGLVLKPGFTGQYASLLR